MPQECRNRDSFMHRLIVVHGLHGTFEAYLRPRLMIHIWPLDVTECRTDRLGNLRSTANETFGRLVEVSKHANVRANSSVTREVCSRERVADGVVPETSHNRKIYVRPKPGKKEDTPTVCWVAKTTFYYTTQTTSKKHYQRKPFAHPSYTRN